MSNSIAPIATIEDSIANAIAASQSFDPAVSENLLSLLKLTMAEAQRVRKATKKVSAKSAPKAKKKPPKSAKKAETVAIAAAPVRRTKKAAATNGVAH